ncbi:MAG: hypothetical protein F6K08_02495 [Okeania sp. SIO1H6]|nr:hypothetical protein [Okeania sp. SIO2B9]NET11787.1 hypothetical protein [Okeania sp. SIO1H6]
MKKEKVDGICRHEVAGRRLSPTNYGRWSIKPIKKNIKVVDEIEWANKY